MKLVSAADRFGVPCAVLAAAFAMLAGASTCDGSCRPQAAGAGGAADSGAPAVTYDAQGAGGTGDATTPTGGGGAGGGVPAVTDVDASACMP